MNLVSYKLKLDDALIYNLRNLEMFGNVDLQLH